MGISRHNLRFLKSIRAGQRGGKMLCLGRQHWCVEKLPLHKRGFADHHLIDALQFDDVHSLDITLDEGATFAHDLNEPIPHPLRGQYDLVYDGGTIEHVFNPVQALDNAAALLKVGGRFVSSQILNLAGHGFWGLTPELLKMWARTRGFDGMGCEVYRLGPFALPRSIDMAKPGRIELTSILPLNMHFSARKDSDRESFVNPVQSGPNMTAPLKFWLKEARVWGK